MSQTKGEFKRMSKFKRKISENVVETSALMGLIYKTEDRIELLR